MIYFKLLKRIITHKFWVAYYCFQVGLYWQGITHDLSKFSRTEFLRSVEYWSDEISSLANEKKINGYSETFLHHRGRNPHHYEYWIHSLDEGGIPAEMPKKYAVELACDYLAACRTYGGNPKDIQSKDLLILDDLCDGGGTFCGIAAELKKYKPDADINIFVTHMVNRRGIENLAKTFNKVYFTNSYRTWDNLPDNVIQIEIV